MTSSLMLIQQCEELWILEKRKPNKGPKVNPNQLKSAAVKAQKELLAAKAKAKKSGASSSSSSAPKEEKLQFQSRCTLKKLAMSFEEYRESLFASF